MLALPAAVAKAGGMAVMIDSGFRRGTVILKAIGTIANLVFVGRPLNDAATLAGEAGVDHAIDLLRSQLRTGLGMLGLLAIADVDRDLLMLRRFSAI